MRCLRPWGWLLLIYSISFSLVTYTHSPGLQGWKEAINEAECMYGVCVCVRARVL